MLILLTWLVCEYSLVLLNLLSKSIFTYMVFVFLSRHLSPHTACCCSLQVLFYLTIKKKSFLALNEGDIDFRPCSEINSLVVCTWVTLS